MLLLNIGVISELRKTGDDRAYANVVAGLNQTVKYEIQTRKLSLSMREPWGQVNGIAALHDTRTLMSDAAMLNVKGY